MKKLIILTDNKSDFQISKADFRHFKSMEIDKIKNYFESRDYGVDVLKFSELDLSKDYRDYYILYQTSEAPGTFYKHYIEDLIFFLENQGARVLPKYEYLRAHHNKVYMELMRSRFSDKSLKTIKSTCFGSWEEATNFHPDYPIIIKQASSSGGAGVFLAKNRNEYTKYIKKAGKVIFAMGWINYSIEYLRKTSKNLRKFIYPSKSKYINYDTTPLSTPLIVQNFIKGLNGDYRVLVFGNKYYTMYRKNRDNDFRASGSGMFYEVPEKEQEGILNFAKKLNSEIDFPILGMDIGFDGNEYHLLEFQMLHFGTSAIQRSKFWHEFHDGNWVRINGPSDLEEEFSGAIYHYINPEK